MPGWTALSDAKVTTSTVSPHFSLSAPFFTKFPATFALMKPYCLSQAMHLKSTHQVSHIQVIFSLIILILFQWNNSLLHPVKMLKIHFSKMYLYVAIFSLSCIFLNFLNKAPFIWTTETCQTSGDFSLERDVSLAEIWIVVISVPAKRDRHFKGGGREGYSQEVNEPHSWCFHVIMGWNLALPVCPRESPCTRGLLSAEIAGAGGSGLVLTPFQTVSYFLYPCHWN